MSSRRWIILAVALVVGLVAGGLVFNYVQGVEDDANEDVVLLNVFVVQQRIEKGTFGDNATSSIVETEIEARFRPDNAVTNLSQISGKVAIADLAPNQIVVTDLFVSQSESLSTFSGLLAKNEVAVTISVDSVAGVAGLLVPGDYVNILLKNPRDAFAETDQADPDAVADDGTGSGSGAEATQSIEGTVVCLDPSAKIIRELPVSDVGQVLLCPQARYLYQKVQILAIGTQRTLQPGETINTNPDGSPVIQNTGLLTLAVPPDAAQWIVSAGNNIVLALVSEDYDPSEFDAGPIAPTRELPAEKEDPTLRSPYPDGIRVDPLIDGTTTTSTP